MKSSERSSLNGDYSELFNLYKVPEKSLDKIEPNTLHNLTSMASEYNTIFGEKIQINSAFRSFQEQQKLKDRYGRKAASPGLSMHNYGLAVDMNTQNANKAEMVGLFKKYGFHRPVSGETWHVEPIGINRSKIRETGMMSFRKIESNTTTPPSSNVFSENDETQQEKSKQSVKVAKVPTSSNTIKTSDLINLNKQSTDSINPSQSNTNKNSVEINKNVQSPQTIKIKKEMVVDSLQKNLTSNSAELYKNNINPEQIAQIVTPIINSNINTSNEQATVDNPFSVFSR